MPSLLNGAGFVCLGGAFVWMLIGAYQEGFLGTALWSMFEDRNHRYATRELFRDHWPHMKGPLLLVVVGVALLMLGARG
jgi:hypothetical protein